MRDSQPRRQILAHELADVPRFTYGLLQMLVTLFMEA